MRVAIKGVGVAGPALAYWLRRFGHDPVLFEKAAAPRIGGYVIDFWGTGYDLAERMGIIDDIVARGYLIDRLSMVDATGTTIAALDLTPVREQLRNRFVTIARNDLCAALVAACDGIELSLHCRALARRALHCTAYWGRSSSIFVRT